MTWLGVGRLLESHQHVEERILHLGLHGAHTEPALHSGHGAAAACREGGRVVVAHVLRAHLGEVLQYQR